MPVTIFIFWNEISLTVCFGNSWCVMVHFSPHFCCWMFFWMLSLGNVPKRFCRKKCVVNALMTKKWVEHQSQISKTENVAISNNKIIYQNMVHHHHVTSAVFLMYLLKVENVKAKFSTFNSSLKYGTRLKNTCLPILMPIMKTDITFDLKCPPQKLLWARVSASLTQAMKVHTAL